MLCETKLQTATECRARSNDSTGTTPTQQDAAVKGIQGYFQKMKPEAQAIFLAALESIERGCITASEAETRGLALMARHRAGETISHDDVRRAFGGSSDQHQAPKNVPA